MIDVPENIQNLDSADSEQFAFVKHHARNAGVIVLPVYGNPARNNPRYANGATDKYGNNAKVFRARIGRLHAPIESLVITWTGIKMGAAPLLPNPYLFDQNCVFASGRRSVAVPMSTIGYQGNWWSLSGEYTYHMIEPVDLNSSMEAGVAPWESGIKVDDSIVPNTAFLSNMLERPPSGYTKPQYVPPPNFKPQMFDPNNPGGTLGTVQ